MAVGFVFQAPAVAQSPASSGIERVKADLKYLSSDELKGRSVGSDGLNLAADFVRDEFKKAGLDVTSVNGGAFQFFERSTGSELGEGNFLALNGPDGKSIALEIDKNFRTCSFGNAGEFEGELAFCGYSISAPQMKYNDFADIDVKGKVAVIIRRTPQQKTEGSPFLGRRARFLGSLRTKVSNAVRAGAVAVILVNDTTTSKDAAEKAAQQLTDAEAAFKEARKARKKARKGDDADAKEKAESAFTAARTKFKTLEKQSKEINDFDELVEFGYGGDVNESFVPVFHLKQASANELFQAAIGKTQTDLEEEIDSDLKPRSQVLTGWSAKGLAAMKKTQVEVKNVIGVLEGEGDHADETVVIGAHYDHVGMGAYGSLSNSRGQVHNGADDNASGTVALLELARRFQASGKKPARRIVFIAFTAEELGLLGSKEYCDDPVFPLDKTVAMYNMDMVGRLTGNHLTIYGTGTATGWDKWIAELGVKHKFDLTLSPAGLGPSDHASFYRKQIPVLHFFTGTHPQYHRPADDWELVNFKGIGRIIDLVEEIVVTTINADDRPEYLETRARARIQSSSTRPYFGIVPNLNSDEQGLMVASVAEGGPAEKAGIKPGDVIVKFGGKAIDGLGSFDTTLRATKIGEQTEIVVKRDNAEVTLQIELKKAQ